MIKSDIFKLGTLCLFIFLTLLLAEFLKNKKKLKKESLRKFTHMVTGVMIAFTPLYLSWPSIILLSGAFLVTVLVSLRLNIFSSIHGVGRKTYGEILYPVAIGVLAIAQPEFWIFMVAVLHLALADGLAAIFGAKYGKNSQYKIFGGIKSLAGSMTFLVASITILVLTKLLLGQEIDISNTQLFILLPVLITILEGISIYGYDNFTVPIGIWLLIISL